MVMAHTIQRRQLMVLEQALEPVLGHVFMEVRLA